MAGWRGLDRAPRLAAATRSRAGGRPPRRAGHPRRLPGLLPVPLRARQRRRWPRTRCSGWSRWARCRRSRAARRSAPARCWPCCRSGWVLVTLGTLLSVTTATAVAGMFVLGFAVAYAGIGGPRLVGLATGTQLLYILPCFPPFDPGSLGLRLAGLTLGVLLLAAAEVTLWPDADADAVHARSSATPSARSRAAWTRWPTCGRDGPRAGSGSRPRCPRRPTPPRRCGPRGCRPVSGPPPRGAATARSRPPRARPGCCWAARSTCRSSTTTAPSRSRRPPPSCARPPRARTRRRPGCAARRRRCPTPTAIAAALAEFRAARAATVTRRPAAGAAAARIDGARPRRVDEVDGGRDPGRGGRADPAGRHAAVGATRPALVRLPQHPVAVVAPAPRAPHAALGLLPGRAAAGRWPSRWPGCWPACSTCPTASGCCSPCSPCCAPRPRTPARRCAPRWSARPRARSSPRRCWWSACPRRSTRSRCPW